MGQRAEDKEDAENCAQNKPVCVDCALGSLWAFMKAMPWSSMEVHGFVVQAPQEIDQPQRFIPVFETLEGAKLFAGEDKHLIVELRVST